MHLEKFQGAPEQHAKSDKVVWYGNVAE